MNLDPPRQFPFRLSWRGKVVAGFAEVSGIHVGPEQKEHRDEGNPQSIRLTRSAEITLKRGIIYDQSFLAWFYGVGGAKALASEDVHLSLADENGHEVLAFVIRQCWISKHDSCQFKAGANELAVEAITLQNGGYEIKRLDQ